MRYLLIMALVTRVVASAGGETVDLRSNRSDAQPRPSETKAAYDSREGGEDIGTAIEIPGDVSLLPYHDTGETCDNLDDYDEVCPSGGSTAPDVVYSFTPSEDVIVNVDLCASTYNTKVYVYDASQTLLACNETGVCGQFGGQSFIYGLSLGGNATYYVVVDGYGQSCGAYDLLIDRTLPCVVDCPRGAMIEGEQGCYEDYYDDYDGGCAGSGWLPVVGDEQGCATVCGTGCTYLYNGWTYRDTDWYEATAAGGPVTFACEAEFPLQMVFFGSANCNTFMQLYATAMPCSPAELTFSVNPGTELWLVVMPTVFYGVPESDYVCTACGLAPGPTPVEETTWGRIKSRYREPVR